MPGIRLWKNPIALPILLPLFLQIAPAQSISGPDKVQVNTQASYSTTLGATDLQCPVDENGDPLTPSSTITYTWTFSDDQSTTSTTDGTASVNHTFKTKGTYTVTVDLKAPVQEPGYDGQYCTATASLSVTAFTLSITASKSAIAAGAVPNDAHQTSISVTTDPAVNIPLNVVVHGGAGSPPHTNTYAQYGTFTYGRPASLTFGSQGTITGTTNPNPTQLALSTGSSGSVSGILTSSDAEESCTITASFEDGTPVNTIVAFEACTYSWKFPSPPISYGKTGTVTINVTHNGTPVPGHVLGVYASTITVVDNSYAGTLAGQQLSDYLKVNSWPTTNSNGSASFTISIQHKYFDTYALTMVDLTFNE